MIRLLNLYLKDFMSINEATLDFDNHINFIIGNPGTGKSAIFEAINICLSDEKRSKTYGEYVQQGKDQAIIKLKCLINNKEANFDITLNCVKGTPFDGELSYENKIYKGSSQISDFLKTLELDYYLRIMFSMQNQKNIVDYTPSERLSYLQKLFDCDFSEQKDVISTRLRDTKDTIEKLTNEKNTNLTLINELSRLDSLKENKLTKDEYIEVLKSVDSYKNELLSLKESMNKSQSISKQICELENEIKTNKKNLEEKDTYNKAIETLTKELSSLKEKKNTFEPQRIELEDKIKKIIEDIDSYENEIKNEREESQKCLISITKGEAEVEDFLKKRALVEKGLCPNCGQPTTDLYPHIGSQLLNAQLSVQNLKKTRTEYISKINELENKNKELLSKKETLEKELNNINLDAQYVYSQIVSREHDLNTYKEKMESLSKISFEDLIQKQEKELENLRQSEASLEEIKNNSEKIETKIEALRQTISDYETIEKLNEETRKRNKNKEERCETLKARNNEIDENRLNSQNELNTLNDSYVIFNKTLPQYISKKTSDVLESNINGFIHTVFPNFDVKLENTERGCELKYTKDRALVDKKRNDKLNSKMTSGFERSVLDLSFKVSLAQSFGLDLFIGDEVDGACGDEFAIELIKEVLNKENFKQIFIISHKPNLVKEISEIFEGCNIYETDSGSFKKRDF